MPDDPAPGQIPAGGMMTSAPVTPQADEDPGTLGYSAPGWTSTEELPALPDDPGGWSTITTEKETP